jgi:hypothetical protein
MTDTRQPDAGRTKLRALIAAIEREIPHLTPPVSDTGARSLEQFLGSWAQLMDALALGPEPELRTCPACLQLVMSAATRCGYCWTKLKPLHAEDGARPGT